MEDEIDIQEIFSWLGTGLTICFIISPAIPFTNMLRGKLKYEDTPIIVVSTIYVNCFCWFFYGKMIEDEKITMPNMIGIISSLILISIYLICEIRKFALDTILNALIIMVGTYILYRALTILIQDNVILSKICNFTLIIVYLSPVQLINRVVKEKRFTLIPIYTAYISLLASSCWIIYGMLFENIIFPNLVGLLLAIIQIIVYFYYKKKFSGFEERDFSSTIGIESSSSEEGKKEESTCIKIDEDQSNEKEKPVKIISKIDN